MLWPQHCYAVAIAEQWFINPGLQIFPKQECTTESKVAITPNFSLARWKAVRHAHEITQTTTISSWGWQGPLESPAPTRAQAGTPIAGCSGPRPRGFWRSPRRRPHSLSLSFLPEKQYLFIHKRLQVSSLWLEKALKNYVGNVVFLQHVSNTSVFIVVASWVLRVIKVSWVEAHVPHLILLFVSSAEQQNPRKGRYQFFFLQQGQEKVW